MIVAHSWVLPSCDRVNAVQHLFVSRRSCGGMALTGRGDSTAWLPKALRWRLWPVAKCHEKFELGPSLPAHDEGHIMLGWKGQELAVKATRLPGCHQDSLAHYSRQSKVVAGITHLLGYLHERQRKAAVGGSDLRLERGCSLLGRISDGSAQVTDFDLSTILKCRQKGIVDR